MENLKLDIQGIKCDNCDFIDKNVDVKDYEKWLNKSCPKCGANLLTQEDFDTVESILSFQKIVNKMTFAHKNQIKLVSIKKNQIKYILEELK